jgi:SAM-dependent methyltransferase
MSDTRTIAPWRAIWSGLSVSWAYRLFGRLVGAHALRTAYVHECVRPREGDRVLDIGCGPGDILNFLPPVSYVGFDINPDYIQAARARFGQRAQFFQQAIDRELVGRFSDFDIVMANGLLHHLDDAGAGELLTIAFTALKPGGRLITLDGVISPDQSRAAYYLVSHDRGRFMRTEAGYTQLAGRVFPHVKAQIWHSRLRIPYTHIVMECQR